MKRRRKNSKKLWGYLSSLLLASQTVCASQAQAEQLEYEGTTQISTVSYYLDADVLEAELEVAEVYVQSGSTVSQGDALLKLTEESYLEAADYYAAALIRAENDLTDAQLEYDQGMLETQYTYDTALAKADQAEFIREYQQKELEDTISEHEEVLEELEERIAELESEIAAGSYESSSSSSGTVGGNSSGGGSGGWGDMERESESETEGMSEPDPEGEEGQPETGADEPEGQPGSGTDGTESQPETGTQESEGQPGSGMDGTESQPEASTDESEDRPETETDAGTNGQEMEARISEIKTRLSEKNQEYQETIEKIEALGLQISGEETAEETEGQKAESEDLDGQLEASIAGDTNVKTNLENVQKNLSSVPETVMEVVKAAYPDYEDYIELLDQCISQLQTDIQLQENVKEAIGGEEASGLDEEVLESLLSELYQIGTEKSELYGQLVSLQETWIQSLQTQSDGEGETGTGTESGPDTGAESESGSETESEPGTGAEGESGSETESEPGTGAEGESGSEMESEPGSETESETEFGAGNGQQPGEGWQPESETGTDEDENGQGASGMAGSGSLFGGSGSASGLSQAVGETAVSESGSIQMENWTVSEEDISLFGDTYDLTQVQNLLEREATDSDTAESLLEELEESQETVEEQYQELTREQKITELEIQYTYDTSVISGKLAEFTYQEEKQDWEELLAEAETEKEELEEKKAFLDSMTDGILTADQDGTVAEVTYEAGDVITETDPVITYYDMDTVTISIQVPQEEIAALKVGDAVTASISGMWDMEGTVTEKAVEPVSDTSRTTVEYQVNITVDNTDGRLSAGLSASVAVPEQQEESQTEE